MSSSEYLRSNPLAEHNSGIALSSKEVPITGGSSGISIYKKLQSARSKLNYYTGLLQAFNQKLEGKIKIQKHNMKPILICKCWSKI